MRITSLAVLVTLAACSHHETPVDAGAAGAGPPPTAEARLRSALGIPPDARKVLIFGQASHLDIDWQKTFDGYYQSWVHDIFVEARQILETQPDAFYTVTEMGYLKYHVQLHPEELAPLRAAAGRGALHIVGGGMTSPDDVLPETELLLRDYLYGTRFSEDMLGIRPHSAYVPDSFGHSATFPDILAAAGFDSVAFARIDGAPTILQVYSDPPLGPQPPEGSTAALLRQAGSADFVWRGAGGGEVLAHWLDGLLYCEGDTIDYANDLPVPGGHLGTFDDSPGFVEENIDGYLADYGPTAATPYIFVAVGCDFQHPKPDLLADIADYDQNRYPETGAWAVAAPFDDYAQLVAAHRAALPVVAQDLTPYFMGFYGSRPDIKRATRDAARPFFEAESYATALGPAGAALVSAAAPALERLTFADHHDFITGTANDEVAADDQRPLLGDAQAAGDQLLAAVTRAVAGRIPAAAGDAARVVVFNPADYPVSDTVDVTLPAGVPSGLAARVGGAPVPVEVLGRSNGTRVRVALSNLPPWGWRTVDLVAGAPPTPNVVGLLLLDDSGRPATGAAVRRVVLTNEHVRAQWDLDGSFALTSLAIDGVEALAGPSFGVTTYSDQGGLWRLGHEMPGCSFTPRQEGLGADAVEVLDQSGLSATVAFVTPTATREARLDAGDRGLRLAVTMAADPATTRTVSFDFASGAGAELRTSQPGGFVTRTPQAIWTPTFWPAVAWVSDGPWAVLLRQSTGAHFDGNGLVELLAARNAQQEQCDFLGGVGSDPAAHRFEWYVTSAVSPADAARQAQAFDRPLIWDLGTPASTPAAPLPSETSLAGSQGDGIVSAVKPADRGEGTILRALLLPGPLTVDLGAQLQGRTMMRTDAVERDLAPAGTSGPTLVLSPATYGAIATVRFEPGR